MTPAINGTPLTQLIAAFESGQQFEPAGGYGGLVPQFFDYGPLDRYLLGECEPGSYWGNLVGIYVLGCDCGEEFVAASEVDPIYLDPSSYVMPDGAVKKPYTLLYEALRRALPP